MIKARRGGKYTTARRLGKEVCAFARLHQQTLNMPDEQIYKLAAICQEHEARWRLLEIPENELKKIERKAEAATQRYYQRLLEELPQGRKRTEH